MAITTESIWKAFHKELLGFIKKKVRDEDIANDLLQDIFIKIHLKLDTLSDKDKLTSWVYQITRNTILDLFKKSRNSTVSTPELSELNEAETFNNEFGKCLKPFINRLPENYKEAILQTELGQLSQKEFAQNANISYSGAKSRVQRARQQLFEIFNQCCQVTADKYGNILDYKRKKNCSDC